LFAFKEISIAILKLDMATEGRCSESATVACNSGVAGVDCAMMRLTLGVAYNRILKVGIICCIASVFAMPLLSAVLYY